MTPDKGSLLLEQAAALDFYLFSGIADGERFVKFVRSAGLNASGHVLYSDHFRFDAAEMAQIRKNAGKRPLLTTEKDYWRLEELNQGVHYLKIRLAFDQDGEFRNLLVAALKQP
jgi:tetraacyldisaccharide-1-P 4'-kinase